MKHNKMGSEVVQPGTSSAMRVCGSVPVGDREALLRRADDFLCEHDGPLADINPGLVLLRDLAAALRLAVPQGEPRFFVEHGVIHDRKTGRHLHLKDAAYAAEQECEALNAMEAASGQFGGLREDYLTAAFQTDEEAVTTVNGTDLAELKKAVEKGYKPSEATILDLIAAHLRLTASAAALQSNYNDLHAKLYATPQAVQQPPAEPEKYEIPCACVLDGLQETVLRPCAMHAAWKNQGRERSAPEGAVQCGERAGGSALAPCPFCGPGESSVDTDCGDHRPGWRVWCGRCGSSTGTHYTEAEAIATWNRRPTEASPAQPRIAGTGMQAPASQPDVGEVRALLLRFARNAAQMSNAEPSEHLEAEAEAWLPQFLALLERAAGGEKP